MSPRFLTMDAMSSEGCLPMLEHSNSRLSTSLLNVRCIRLRTQRLDLIETEENEGPDVPREPTT